MAPIQTRSDTLPLVGIALNFQGAGAPDWVQLLPAGPDVTGRDGRAWRMPDAATIAARFDAAKLPQIDVEHASQVAAPEGRPAPAVGWITQLEARNGQLWGRVDWTAEGAALVAGKGYRYLSPVFTYSASTNEIGRIVSAGLTNTPNLELAALNAAQPKETIDMVDPTILEALGLTPTASAAEAVLAVNRLKEENRVALNRAQTPDPEKFVPKADLQLALNRISTFEAKDRERAEAEIVAAVDEAVVAGKVAPASKEFHLAACRTEGGLARFRDFVKSAPVIAGGASLADKQPAQSAIYSAEQLAVCRQLDMDPADVFGAKKEAN